MKTSELNSTAPSTDLPSPGDNTPLVTVIISSYNHARYIEASIQSVLDQTYPNIELLVYDDGSRDNSVDIIQRLADRHGFFFQAQTNQGLSRTLNAGLERARGQFIAPFGSDDVMLPDRFTRQVPWLIQHSDVGIAAGNIVKIDENGNQLRAKRQHCYPEKIIGFEELFVGWKNVPPAPTLLFRKEALQSCGGFNPDIRLEDLYIELKITELGWQLGMMKDTLAYYRVHTSNTIKNLRFMHEAVLNTYACFSHHPGYELAVNKWINHQFLRAANRDKALARECLKQLPLSAWNVKTFRGLWRLLTA